MRKRAPERDSPASPVEGEESHASFVTGWMRACALAHAGRQGAQPAVRGDRKNGAPALSRGELEKLLELGVEAIWSRARFTLGDVTLAAILDRVVHTSKERFPALATLRMEGSSARFGARPAGPLGAEDLTAALTFIIVELLTVIGHLTAEVLTPALHSALGMVRLEPIALPPNPPKRMSKREQPKPRNRRS